MKLILITSNSLYSFKLLLKYYHLFLLKNFLNNKSELTEIKFIILKKFYNWKFF